MILFASSIKCASAFTIRLLFVIVSASGHVFDGLDDEKKEAVEKTKEIFDVIVEGPLKDNLLMLFMDPSVQDGFSSFVAGIQSPLFLINPSYTDADWIAALPPNHIQKEAVIIIITQDLPVWLFDIDHTYYFSQVLVLDVCNCNSTLDIMEIEQLQKARLFSLIRIKTEMDRIKAQVFSSFPLEKKPNGDSSIRSYIGEWNTSTFSHKKYLFPERFASFNGEVLNVASDIYDFPFITGHNETEAEGTNIMILEAIGNWLNFTFTVTEKAPDGFWGEKENGSWNGLLGEVYAENKNLTMNYFTLVPERVDDFDYSKSYFSEGFGFALLIPPPLPAWMSLVYPFDLLTWICTFLSVIFISFVIFLFYWPLRFHVKESISFAQTFYYSLMSLLRVNCSWNPSSDTLRILLGFWWLTCFLLSTSYTSNLIAVLTVPVYPERIKTVAALAKSKFSVAMIDYGEFVPDALATSQNTDLRKMGSRLHLLEMLEDEDETYENLVTELLSGESTITETYSYLRGVVSQHEVARTKSYFLKEQIYSGALVFFYPKRTPWTHRLDYGITRLVEGGLINKWYDQFMKELETKEGAAEEENKSLTLHHLQGPFIILGIGFIASATVFLMESFALCCQR